MKNDIAALMHKILEKNKSSFKKLAEFEETRMADLEDYEETAPESEYSENMCYVILKKYSDGITEVVGVTKSEETAKEMSREERGGADSIVIEVAQMFD